MLNTVLPRHALTDIKMPYNVVITQPTHSGYSRVHLYFTYTG